MHKGLFCMGIYADLSIKTLACHQGLTRLSSVMFHLLISSSGQDSEIKTQDIHHWQGPVVVLLRREELAERLNWNKSCEGQSPLTTDPTYAMTCNYFS